jgi:L-ascorbate metabolism protein UlaG (beta-lactamase superfamily)
MFKTLAIILLIFSTALSGIYWYLNSITYYEGPASDHFNGKLFFNPYDQTKHPLKKFIKWQLNRKPGQWPSHLDVERYDIPPRSFDEGIRASYVGHATVLLQVNGINILTDPIWSKRAGLLWGLGPKRVIDPGIKFDDLPKIDLVLISHNHYDHMDRKTIRALVRRDNPKFIVPLGNDIIIKSFARDANVVALDWFDSLEYESLQINMVPVLHWSSRVIFDRNKALWAGFVIESSVGNIYFAGDSALESGKVYDIVREKFGDIKLSLIPTGTYEPREFMKNAHNNPDDAMNAFRRLNSKYAIAIHHGVFQLSDESYSQQKNDFSKALVEHDINHESFRMLKVGEAWVVD